MTTAGKTPTQPDKYTIAAAIGVTPPTVDRYRRHGCPADWDDARGCFTYALADVIQHRRQLGLADTRYEDDGQRPITIADYVKDVFSIEGVMEMTPERIMRGVSNDHLVELSRCVGYRVGLLILHHLGFDDGPYPNLPGEGWHSVLRRISDSTPDELIDALNQAFAPFWTDPEPASAERQAAAQT